MNSLYASYFVACLLLLWRRTQKSILDPNDVKADSSQATRNINLPGSAGKLVWGPWRIPEPWGTIVNALACAYLIIVFVFTFFPPTTPVTPLTMNYSVLVMGFVAIASAAYYWIWGHHSYKGPVVDVDKLNN